MRAQRMRAYYYAVGKATLQRHHAYEMSRLPAGEYHYMRMLSYTCRVMAWGAIHLWRAG